MVPGLRGALAFVAPFKSGYGLVVHSDRPPYLRRLCPFGPGPRQRSRRSLLLGSPSFLLPTS